MIPHLNTNKIARLSATSALKIGQKVKIVVDPPDGGSVEGVVKIIQNIPGKQVGVQLSQPVAFGNTLDGLITGNPGQGWWTREENIEIL